MYIYITTYNEVDDDFPNGQILQILAPKVKTEELSPDDKFLMFPNHKAATNADADE